MGDPGAGLRGLADAKAAGGGETAGGGVGPMSAMGPDPTAGDRTAVGIMVGPTAP